MNIVLSVLLVLAILGYCVFLARRLWKDRGKGCGSCGGCPMAGSCHKAEKK